MKKSSSKVELTDLKTDLPIELLDDDESTLIRGGQTDQPIPPLEREIAIEREIARDINKNIDLAIDINKKIDLERSFSYRPFFRPGSFFPGPGFPSIGSATVRRVTSGP